MNIPKDIKEECKACISCEALDSILWYLNEHQDEMNVWAEAFKEAYCEMVDSVLECFEREDD